MEVAIKKNKNGGDGLENLAIGLWRCISIGARICFFGLRRVNFNNFDLWCWLIIVTSLIGMIFLGPINYLQETHSWMFGSPPSVWPKMFFGLPRWGQFFLVTTSVAVGSLMVLGFRDFRTFIKAQQTIDNTGLKTALDKKPKVKAIVPLGENRSKVVITTNGVALEKFESHRGAFVTGFRQKVESIELAEDKGLVEIFLCSEDLPKMVGFEELYSHVKQPYSFVIGKSSKGPVIQSIRSLPHMLISGATGGGKSVFFRSTMLSLLKSSPHIQLYLLDLKRGVEVKEFSALPNVKTAKDEVEATNVLSALVEEMNKRYKILEEKGVKSIDPKRDKLDLIVVGIDEAAALFGNKENDLARKYIGQLARLARAAGIHLIPATQKPVKEAISTEALDNLPGRMTFRVISSAASNVAMGCNLAKKLPAINGRAIWTNGSEHTTVQTPFVDDEIAGKELEAIAKEFSDGTRKNFQELLETSKKTSMTDVREDKE